MQTLEQLALPVGLAAVAGTLVDEHVGIVRSLEEVRREAGSPEFFHFAAKACDTSAFTRQRNFADTGGAAGDRGRAAAKAIGEAVERYCSAIYDIDEMPLYAYSERPGVCTAPEEFALYSAEQYDEPGFPWVRFEEDSPIRWTRARDVLSGESVNVPAARVYMPYSFYVGTDDSPIDQPISTGLACHEDYERAALAAACEVVERDAVMIMWQAMMAVPQIRIETLPDDCYDLVQRFDRTGGRVTMLDITLDHGVPTILSVLRSTHSGAPALVVAASAAPDPREAARKSLEELAHTRRFCQYVRSHLPPHVPDPPRYESVVDQLTHLSFYVAHENVQLADFLWASDQRRSFEEIKSAATGDPAEDLRAVAGRIGNVGERLLIADLTTADVASLGLSVVRAVVPGFQPLHMGHRLRSLGGRRLWTVPQQLGYVGVSPETGDNPAPHPYP